MISTLWYGSALIHDVIVSRHAVVTQSTPESRPLTPPYGQRMPMVESCSIRSGARVAALLRWFPIHAPSRSSRSSWPSPLPPLLRCAGFVSVGGCQ
jgi:hypothetical protein